MLKNGNKSAKFESVSPIILMNLHQFSKKEIENFQELLPTYVNPSRRFRESPRCFRRKHFKTLKWLPKIKAGKENVSSVHVDQKDPQKIWCDSPLKKQLHKQFLWS